MRGKYETGYRFKLAEIKNITGIKESSGSLAQLQEYIHHFDGTGFKIFQGITDLAAASLLLGADGFIPVLAPHVNEIYLALYQACRKGDMEQVRQMNRIVADASRILSAARNATSAAKYAISTMGLSGEKVLRPCEPLTLEEKKKIDGIIAQVFESFKKSEIHDFY